MIFTVPMWPIDGLSKFMLIMIACLFPMVFVYSLAYVRRNFFRYYFVLLLALIGMVGSVLARDLLTLYVFLEIMTVGIYFLIIDNTKKESFPAGFKYILMMFLGGLFLLLASLMLYNLTGTFDLAAIANVASTLPQAKLGLIFGLFLIGFLFEVGTVPFHIWLPEAHPVAPSPISALLSGIAIKIGAYGVLRLMFVLGLINSTLVWAGAISMLFGVVLALKQTNIKKLLAYSSISQMGYVVLGFGLATGLGVSGGLFHMLNHAMFKMLLFLCAGAIIFATRERDLDKLGGLGQRMPLTTLAFAFGALAITGIPPFNGFASKALLSAAASAAPALKVVLVLTSAGTFALMLKLFCGAFLGELPAKLEQTKEVPWLMVLPMLLLAAGCLVVGLMAQPVLGYVASAVGLVLDKNLWSFWLFFDAGLVILLGSGIYWLVLRSDRLQNIALWDILSLDRLSNRSVDVLVASCNKMRQLHARNLNTHLLWMIIALVILLCFFNYLIV
ncbi:MAG: proton-conducting transporter membrane subunit [Candidatus Margulisiibacteriota bacterium]